MNNGSNCGRKSQLSDILTEPLNPRVRSGTGVIHGEPTLHGEPTYPQCVLAILME